MPRKSNRVARALSRLGEAVGIKPAPDPPAPGPPGHSAFLTTVEDMMKKLILPALLLIGAAACDDDPSEPNIPRDDVVGTYAITSITFDPQGSLPPVDIHTRFGTTIPASVIVSSNGTLQFIVQDAATQQLITVNGTYRTTSTGIDVTFPASSQFQQILLSERMAFMFNEAASTLTFSGEVDDISRARLIALVPELADEQLLDPTPGTLSVTLTRTATQ